MNDNKSLGAVVTTENGARFYGKTKMGEYMSRPRRVEQALAL